MSKYPEYRQSRRSFGINVLGTLVVEIEDSAGNIGFAVTTGGEPAAYMASGRMRLSMLDQPGFGVTLNPECQLHRPYRH